MSSVLMAAQIVVVALLASAYALRARLLARHGRPLSRASLLCAAAGFAVLLASMLILRQPGRELLTWRTLERLLVGDLGCLLIAIGLTDAVLAPLARTPLRRLRVLTRTPVALALWIANLLVWQWPSIFDATLRHSSLTLLMDVVSIAVGLNMWRALLSALAATHTGVSQRDRVAYTLIGRLVGVALASVAIWSPDVYYSYFMRADAAYIGLTTGRPGNRGRDHARRDGTGCDRPADLDERPPRSAGACRGSRPRARPRRAGRRADGGRHGSALAVDAQQA